MIQAHDPSVDTIICDEVTRLVSCTLHELVQRLPAYLWGQVFSAVDRLSRTTRFGYVLTVYLDPLLLNRCETDVERYGVGETADSILVGP